jgi:hypothetical protein
MTTPDPTDDEPETVEAEVSEVLDPEDYNQNQRLKQIHEARRDVRKALREVTNGRAAVKDHIETHRRLAEAVAFYGHELAPLMDEVGYEGELPDGAPVESVYKFVMMMGRIEPMIDEDYVPKHVTMVVYKELSKFAREHGLGVSLADSDDEWEV